MNYCIDLLEKTHVIFKLNSRSRNLRNEIKVSKNIYFYDSGIRNALIGNFPPFAKRTDIGTLWENFLINERVKLNSYNSKKVNLYFWRTKQQQKIDLIEEDKSILKAFELKWYPWKVVNFSKTFIETYKATTQILHRENFMEFLK